nr:uncharacterized protein LOC109401158 [Aedes albopictus]
MRICGHHFVKGKPADLLATDDIDWVPTLLLPSHQNGPLFIPKNVGSDVLTGCVTFASPDPEKTEDVQVTRTEVTEDDLRQTSPPTQGNVDPNTIEYPEESPIRLYECWETFVPDDSGFMECELDNTSADNVTQSMCPDTFKEDVCTQTDTSWIRDSAEHEKVRKKLLKENDHLKSSIEGLRMKLSVAEEATRYSVRALESDDRKCKYITGIASGRVLRLLYEALKHDLPNTEPNTAFPDTQEQMFILALRKIRLNEPFYTLGLIYNLHHSTVADKVFQIVHRIYPFMSRLVKWPSRETLKKHMPAAFREKYGDRVTIIIDCFGTVSTSTTKPLKY